MPRAHPELSCWCRRAPAPGVGLCRASPLRAVLTKGSAGCFSCPAATQAQALAQGLQPQQVLKHCIDPWSLQVGVAEEDGCCSLVAFEHVPLDWGDTSWGCWCGSTGRVVCGLRSVSRGRTERATAVLLADPCFQLRSIQYLLGHAEPSALAAAAPAVDKRHFSLHTCKCWHCSGSWAVPTTHPQLGREEWGGWCLCPLPCPSTSGDRCLCSPPPPQQ